MSEKRWIINSVTQKDIPFKDIFDQRNKYKMTKEEFFQSKEPDIYDPMLIKGMKEAVENINKAMKEDKKICIYGDYDVDGTTATSILLKTFEILGYKNVMYYIPLRDKEGYGLNNKAIEKIKEEGCDMIITVDCGITSTVQAEFAGENEIEMIITDHHQLQENVPDAYAILNPHQKDCPYPFKNLCGAGIAYKLSKALLNSNSKDSTDELIELAGIATVADVMEINGENRLMVKKAIEMIKKGKNKGIDEILKVAEISKDSVDTYTIGFQIGPRINSAGRIDDSRLAVKLLTSHDEKRINEIAIYLNNLNARRQEMVIEELEEALIQAEEHKDDYITIVYSEKFEKGIVGLVASKLLEKYGKPSIVMAVDENQRASGSCRSIEAVDIKETLERFRDYFIAFGGHKMAAGLTMQKDKIEDFRKEIDSYLKTVLTEKDFVKKINVDAMIPKDMINHDNYKRVNMFKPFGISNPGLKFASTDIYFENWNIIGKKANHLKAGIKDTDVSIIMFNIDDEIKNMDISKPCDIVYSIDENVYNNVSRIQARIDDIRYSKSVSYEDIFRHINMTNEYFMEGGEVELEDRGKFEILKFEDIKSLEGTSLFLSYSYDSYYYMKKVFGMQDMKLTDYTQDCYDIEKYMISFMPVLEMTDIDAFDNIVFLDEVSKTESILSHVHSKKYIIDSESFCIKSEKEDIRKNMVYLYNYIKKYTDGEVFIKDVLKDIKINTAMFFISALILETSKLIDIKYDFKYNKVYAKIIHSDETVDLNENISYRKFNEYMNLLQ